MGISNCQTIPELPPFSWEAEIWAGDSEATDYDEFGNIRSMGGITRDDQTLFCRDPGFDEFAAIRYEDIRSLQKAILDYQEELRILLLKCERWAE